MADFAGVVEPGGGVHAALEERVAVAAVPDPAPPPAAAPQPQSALSRWISGQEPGGNVEYDVASDARVPGESSGQRGGASPQPPPGDDPGSDDSEPQTPVVKLEVVVQTADGEQRVWADFCQMLLASNAFLYGE